ncbi:monovalent cation/H+ antiporter subunit D family protein [Thermodesulfobacteriota bacterium]
MSQYPILLIIAPLLSAFLITIAGWFGRKIHSIFGAAALAVSCFCSIQLLRDVISHGPLSYRLGGWAPPIGIEYYIDHLSALILVLVSSIALLNFIATRTMVEGEYGERTPVFYALYLLAVTGHLGIVVTGDAFNLYVLLEISALSGYALLAMGNERAPFSSLRYLLMGTVGASFYLLGVGYLYIMTGSLNMLDLAALLPGLYNSMAVMAAFGLIMIGLWIKMAFFPLHTWLPNSYSDAFAAASSLIAPMTTKVMIYVMMRMMLTVFTPQFSLGMQKLSSTVVWLAVVAMVMGAFFSLSQRDLRRMLSYIIVSEVGYMVGGAWLGNRMGMTGSILHIVNDALMTFCVFLAVAAIASQKGTLHFDGLKGIFRKMPFTMGAFVVGGLSMIGVPPTCGFFSKWYLILGGIEAGHYGFVCALVASSLINVVLFFRVFEIAYFEPFSGHAGNGDAHGHKTEPLQEANWDLLAVLLGVTIGLFVVGLLTGEIVGRVVEPAIPAQIM